MISNPILERKKAAMFILLLNVAAVLIMTGFIWTMQLVHYPLFDRVGADAFPGYETDHNRLFSWWRDPELS